MKSTMDLKLVLRYDPGVVACIRQGSCLERMMPRVMYGWTLRMSIDCAAY